MKFFMLRYPRSHVLDPLDLRVDCVFQSIPATDSGRSRPSIPVEAGRLIRYLSGTTTSTDANFHKREEDRYGLLGTPDNVTDAAGNVTRIGYDSLSRKTSMTDPGMGYWTYQYDANGNLAFQTDARSFVKGGGPCDAKSGIIA